MKFLLMGDRHAGPITPGTRIDNFKETCRLKDLEIIGLAHKYNVTAILEPGDFWEEGRSKLPNEYIQMMIERWFGQESLEDILEEIKKIPQEEVKDFLLNRSQKYIKMIGIVGNHELLGGSIDNFEKSTAGLMDYLGKIKIVSKDKPIIFTDTDTGKTIAISGTSYHAGMDRKGNINDYIVDKKVADFQIHMVHGMLVLKPLAPNRLFTTIDQIRETKADVTFCGHIHTGFKTTEYDGRYFVNPGSPLRLSASKSEMKRIVHVTLLDIDTKTGKITLKDIPLKSALEAEKVLTRDGIEFQKNKDTLVDYYNSEVQNFKLNKEKNIEQILEDVMNSQGVSDELKKKFREKVLAKKTENKVEIPPIEDSWIEYIQIHNFQSYTDEIIEFSKGFNVITGDSNHGKSAILRAIRWVYQNKPSGTSFMRHGELNTNVTIKLANGTQITRNLEVSDKDIKKPVLNEYVILYPDGSEKRGNTKLLPEVQKSLGFLNFFVEDGLSLDINFTRQGCGWFLLSDSGPQRAKVVGNILDSGCVDSAMRDSEQELSKSVSNIAKKQKEKDKIETELVKYEDLPEAQKELQALGETVKRIQKIEELIEKIKLYSIELTKLNKDREDTKFVIQDIEKRNLEICLEAVSLKLSSIILVIQKRKELEFTIKEKEKSKEGISLLSFASVENETVPKLYAKLNKISQIYNKKFEVEEINLQKDLFAKIAGKFTDADEARQVLKDLDNKYKDIVFILNNQVEFARLFKLIKNGKRICQACGISDDLKEIEKRIMVYSTQLELVMRLKGEIEVNRKEFKNTKKEIEFYETDIKKKTKQYQKLLSDLGICPTCGQKIDEELCYNE